MIATDSQLSQSVASYGNRQPVIAIGAQ